MREFEVLYSRSADDSPFVLLRITGNTSGVPLAHEGPLWVSVVYHKHPSTTSTHGKQQLVATQKLPNIIHNFVIIQ